MTELTTAKRWIADLRKRERPPEGTNLVGWVTESEIAEVQRNAAQHHLAAAAKAVCWDCHEGVPLFKDGGYRKHGKDEFSATGSCRARNIRGMLEALETPAPTAGTNQKGGGAQCKPA